LFYLYARPDAFFLFALRILFPSRVRFLYYFFFYFSSSSSSPSSSHLAAAATCAACVPTRAQRESACRQRQLLQEAATGQEGAHEKNLERATSDENPHFQHSC
jgi:hypothetical protein